MKYFPILLALLLGATMLHAKPDGDTPEKVDAETEAMAGGSLNAAAVSELEAAVAKNPGDLSARTKLLGFYFMARHGAAKAKENGRQHVLWIIQNRPEAEVAGLPYCQIDAILDGDGYREAKRLWVEQTRAHAKDAAVLGNAAQFFFIHDSALAEDLFKQAQQLEPKDPQWSDKLGHLFALQKGKGSGGKSLAEFEKAQAADTREESKFYRLTDLAKAAFDAGELKKAASYAEELLKAGEKYPTDWNYGNAIHHGNNVLGRIALKQGDIKGAKAHLLKAGQTPGSPQLDSFGPNMSLAKELLEAGEKETVLQYFEECRKFWKMHGESIDRWTKDVKAGRVPSFGANLVY